MRNKILQEKYKNEITFATRTGKSGINYTFTVAWYNKQKGSASDEEEHIIKPAAGFYPAIEIIKTTMNLYPLHYKQLSKNL